MQVWFGPPNDERWSAGLHVNNLTDKRYMTSGYQFLTVNPDGSIPLNSADRPTSTLGREGAVAPTTGIPGRSSRLWAQILGGARRRCPLPLHVDHKADGKR